MRSACLVFAAALLTATTAHAETTVFPPENPADCATVAGITASAAALTWDGTGNVRCQGVLKTDPNGNVGIGTATPIASLHIRVPTIDNNMTGILVEEDSSLQSSPRIGMVDTALGDLSVAPVWFIDNLQDRFRIYRQPTALIGGVEMLTITNQGNVGIGTETPNTSLDINGSFHVNGAINPLIGNISFGAFPASGGPADLNYDGGTDSHFFFYHYGDHSGDTIFASSANGNIMTLKNEGNVGIGTGEPQAKLDVNGGVKLGTDMTCNAAKAGTLSYNGGHVYVCNGAALKELAQQ